MWRREAVERYILLRLHVEDIKRLAHLVDDCEGRTIRLSKNAPFTLADLKGAARTALFTSLAGLVDRDGRATFIFDPLLSLFPRKSTRIVKVEYQCERCHYAIKKFRPYHGSIQSQIKVRKTLTDQDTFTEIESARRDFLRLMDELVSQELKAIPELPEALEQNGLSQHPAFAHYFRNLASESDPKSPDIKPQAAIGE